MTNQFSSAELIDVPGLAQFACENQTMPDDRAILASYIADIVAEMGELARKARLGDLEHSLASVGDEARRLAHHLQDAAD